MQEETSLAGHSSCLTTHRRTEGLLPQLCSSVLDLPTQLIKKFSFLCSWTIPVVNRIGPSENDSGMSFIIIQDKPATFPFPSDRYRFRNAQWDSTPIRRWSLTFGVSSIRWFSSLKKSMGIWNLSVLKVHREVLHFKEQLQDLKSSYTGQSLTMLDFKPEWQGYRWYGTIPVANPFMSILPKSIRVIPTW